MRRASTLLAMALGCVPLYARAADSDVQVWNAFKAEQRWSARWSTSLDGQLRLQDNVSQFSALVLDAAAFHHAGDRFKLGAGFQYTVAPPGRTDEQAPWQSVSYAHQLFGASASTTLRLDERLRDDVDGVLPRLRLGSRLTYPLDGKWYLAASEEVRFNLRDTGAGPVSGFEQNRLYGGVGRRIDDFARIEIGYLWRYERERDKPGRSDNVVQLQIVIGSGRRAARKPRRGVRGPGPRRSARSPG